MTSNVRRRLAAVSLTLIGFVFVFAFAFAFATAPAAAQDAQGWQNAKWVWGHAGAESGAPAETLYLRCTFEVKEKPAKAELWITVDNVYMAYLNGEKLGGDSNHATVEKFDVAAKLALGKNVLALEVQNQGGPAGAIARLALSAGGKTTYVVTDRRVKYAKTSDAAWLKTDFDDAAWKAVAELGPANLSPWNITGGPASSGSGGPGFNFQTVDPAVKERQSGEAEAKNFVLPEGFVAELVAADPQLINPVTIALDEKGRIYVSESHTYRFGPSGSPIKPFTNPVIRLDPSSDGKSFQRTLIAEGFDDPVMGIVVRAGKIYLAANNYLFTYDLPPEGPATNKQTLLVDKNKAWNPFGMFVLEEGPDDWLYMSVGNHRIDIKGPDGSISGRGDSGIVFRMRPDGTKMHRLVHGLRVPYAFDVDPFGQHWQLSNGEGNPNRFVRVIEGVDYHCYTRSNVDGTWLTGVNPLSPPCFELHRGAHTQCIRYYGGAYPKEYEGGVLACNWGGHGFPGANRGIFRYVPDEANNVADKVPFVLCSDPYFRPAHILLDLEGNLLIADWYGKDDESDLTGRIWRIRYTGQEPTPGGAARENLVAAADLAGKAGLARATQLLGSPNQNARTLATRRLAQEGPAAFDLLAKTAAEATNPFAAAQALWALVQIDSPEASQKLAAGAKHADWRVRRLAMQLLRRTGSASIKETAAALAADTKPAVSVEAALGLENPAATRQALLAVLRNGGADDAHLRYEIAVRLAQNGDAASFGEALADANDKVRLAGLIAIDVACFDDLPTRPAALAALGQSLVSGKSPDSQLALEVARMHADPALAPHLLKFIDRSETTAGEIAKAIVILKAKGAITPETGKAIAARFMQGIEQGKLKLASAPEHLAFLEFLEYQPVTPFSLAQLSSAFSNRSRDVQLAAHSLARRMGTKGSELTKMLWSEALDESGDARMRAECLTTLVALETKPSVEQWKQSLESKDDEFRLEAIRTWRQFRGNAAMKEALVAAAPILLTKSSQLKDDLESVLRTLEVREQVAGLDPSSAPPSKEELARFAAEALAAIAKKDLPGHAERGRAAFARGACVKCHLSVSQAAPLAPSLKGVGGQKTDYLIESILYPSKTIKTGFETELVETKSGKVLSGLVKDDGDSLRVLNLDKEERIGKSDVESRKTQKISLMPEGQEATLSRNELVDLIVYLSTLR